jgi:hypothetical protein|tara:strand:- start:153 stop:356 length:204 start_codon:yes stop_codon:yes gene_type:complete
MCGDIYVTSLIGPVIRRAFVVNAIHLTVWLITSRIQPMSAFVDIFERIVVKQEEVNLRKPLKLQALC